MSTKVKGIQIFNSVEQGFRHNCDKIYIYFKPNMTMGAKEWIRKICGNTFKVKDKETCETSVRAINQEEERYNN